MVKMEKKTNVPDALFSLLEQLHDCDLGDEWIRDAVMFFRSYEYCDSEMRFHNYARSE